MKSIKLIAYKIENSDLFKSEADLWSKLKAKLVPELQVAQRRMVLNVNDPDKEEDLVCYFKNEGEEKPIFCTMLRIAIGNNVQHINDALFKKNKFTISELNTTMIDAEAVYKHHYYFSVNNKFLVTNLSYTITRLQTYLNWLLGDIFEITPMISSATVQEIGNVESVTFSDPALNAQNNTKSKKPSSENKSFNLNDLGTFAIDYIKSALSDTQQLSDAQLKNIVSAYLVIRFRKPKKGDSDDIKKALGALLKPIADLDNVSIKPRNSSKQIKGSQIQRTKVVEIETTDNKFINEVQLEQEMHKFLHELENEENNS